MTHADRDCPFCHGEGYVWDNPKDFMPISGHTCVCVLRNIELLERIVRLKAAALPERYQDASIEAFHLRGGGVNVQNKDRALPESVSLAAIDEKNADRTAELAAKPLGDTNVIFTGPIGAGKTFLASALLISQIREHGKSGLYLTFLDYIRRLLPEGDEPDAQRRMRDLACSVDVLLIDDLGVEKTSAFALRELWNIVHTRTSAKGRGILLTSNYTLADALMFKDRETRGLTPDQLEAMELGKRIYSRLLESGVLPITWPAGTTDFRKEASPALSSTHRSPTYGDLRDRQRQERLADVEGSTFDAADLAAAQSNASADGEDPFGPAAPASSRPAVKPAPKPSATSTARGAGREAPTGGSTPLEPAEDETF